MRSGMSLRRDHDGAGGSLIASGAPLQLTLNRARTFPRLEHSHRMRRERSHRNLCGWYYFLNSTDFARAEAVNGAIHISQSETKI